MGRAGCGSVCADVVDDCGDAADEGSLVDLAVRDAVGGVVGECEVGPALLQDNAFAEFAGGDDGVGRATGPR
jgi:hypothetical protein